MWCDGIVDKCKCGRVASVESIEKKYMAEGKKEKKKESCLPKKMPETKRRINMYSV